MKGSVLDVMAPNGKFFIDPGEQKPVVMIAGGVGITPSASMIHAIVDAHSQREVELFYSVTNGREHIMKKELEQLIEEYDNIRMYTLYSNPDDLDLELADFDIKGAAVRSDHERDATVKQLPILSLRPSVDD